MFNEGDTQQSLTDKPMALEFPIELEFRNVGFLQSPHETVGIMLIIKCRTVALSGGYNCLEWIICIYYSKD